ncbi:MULTISPECIES: DUF4079 domain-containing protein [Pseudanabaena]|jgi:drug/metabolite transporter (DMT)-like permease|uniref:DUF4079 domain-containing protein n=1 Tax=Pseudanabaena TaxID=1152 RepID=UPI00247AE8D3|nr:MULTISPECIES: DUF4079 domain-containing protein [Pseudanabaena]MEA5488654.1 DUF4079 domain-containing protein [Pseudanabaena sp. CCNP1317]WGS72121.1 DUF4079 domain-containing protein [Pseudanabaena galeata CCNP1313]
MELEDFFALVHPAIAVIVVFPLIGIVTNRAWLVRQRRLQVIDGEKSKIPPVVGSEHVAIGNWLSISVVGAALLGMAYPIFSKFLKNNVFSSDSLRASFVVAIFIATIASFTFLFKAKVKLGRTIFAALTSIGLIMLGAQPEVFRRDSEWFFSHYYYGIAAAILMIISVAITQDIYKDKQNRWRNIHIILNCFALLLFVGQGMTGARDLLSIPYNWQKEYLRSCDFKTRTCPKSTAFYAPINIEPIYSNL